MIMNVISEMVKNAGNDIDFEFSQENVDQVLTDLEENFGTKIVENMPITHQLMADICEAVSEWKDNTRLNC